MTFEDYSKIELIIQKNLNFIVNNTRLVEALKTDADFSSIFKKNLSFVFSIQKQKDIKNQTNENILGLYNLITNEKFVPNPDMNVESYNETQDEVNWLPIYVRNAYKIDISNGEIIENNNGETIQDTSKAISPAILPVGLPMSDENGNFNENLFGNALKIAEAYKKIDLAIEKNEIYIWNSKPSIIPIIRQIFYYGYSLFGLFFCIFSITQMISAEDGSEFITNFLTIAFGALVTFYGVKHIFSFFTPRGRGDNAKYYFPWRNHTLLVGLFGVFLLSTVFFSNGLNNYFADPSIFETPANIFSFVCVVVLIAIWIILITCLILASVFNPVRNDEFFNKKFAEFFEEGNKKNKISPADEQEIISECCAPITDDEISDIANSEDIKDDKTDPTKLD